VWVVKLDVAISAQKDALVVVEIVGGYVGLSRAVWRENLQVIPVKFGEA